MRADQSQGQPGPFEDSAGQTVGEAWEREAADWIRWARSRDTDHLFWRMSLPSLLGVLPAPGRLTVDVGCGEGRVSRALHAMGHRVIGIEPSPTLAAAAREAAPDIEVHLADGTAIPLRKGAADLCVASMVLLNVDDLDAFAGEIARVLEPGGRFCFSTKHPFAPRPPEASDYHAAVRFTEERERDGVRMTFHDIHRPLGGYVGALERAGLVVEAVREPVPDDDHVAAHPSVERWRRAPCFLIVRARKG